MMIVILGIVTVPAVAVAYFSDTGPFGTFCGKCAFYKAHGRAGYCMKYVEMVRAQGAQVRKRTPSCKYFEAKPKSQ